MKRFGEFARSASPDAFVGGWSAAAIIGSLALHGCLLPEGDGVARGVGDTLPDLGLSGRHPALVWVFDARECLGCKLTEPARTVRAVQRQLGADIEVVVVAAGENGEADRDLVAGFLGSQRISAGIEVRSRAEFVQAFGKVETALFYVANVSGVVEVVLSADDAADWRSTEDSLDLAGFLRVLGRAGPERVDDAD